MCVNKVSVQTHKEKEEETMRGSISLLVVLGMFATGIYIPGVAQAMDEMVFQFRSLEVGDVVPEQVCDRGAVLLDIENQVLPPDTSLVMLDAELWSNRTRAKDGKVVNPESRMVGTAAACAWVSASALFGTMPIDPADPFPSAPFYGEFELGGMSIAAGGECLVSSNTIPVPFLGLVGCTMVVPPDTDQGLLGGNAASSSVFNPLDLPGFQTGSYWTVHIYTE